MSGRTAKSLLSSRIVALLKNEKQFLKNSEIMLLESALKDDLMRHHWLYSLLNTALNNCSIISDEDLNCFNSTDCNSLNVDVASVESLNGDVAFYQQKISLLKKQKEWLEKRIYHQKSAATTEQDNGNFYGLEFKIKQLLQRLKQSNDFEFSFPNTRDVVELIVKELSANFEGLCDRDIDDLLHELSLVSHECDKQILVATFYEKYYEKLSAVKQRLTEVQQKCRELLDYYRDVVRKELSWRKEMNSLSQEFQSNACVLQDNASLRDSGFNDLVVTLNDVEIPNHDLRDDFNEALDHLKEKIAQLQNK